jgi:hypothetical protein
MDKYIQTGTRKLQSKQERNDMASVTVTIGLFIMVSFLSGNSLYDIISSQAMLVNANTGNNALPVNTNNAPQLQIINQLPADPGTGPEEAPTLSEDVLSIGPKQADLTADDSPYDPGTGPEEALTLSEDVLSIGPKQEDLTADDSPYDPGTGPEEATGFSGMEDTEPEDGLKQEDLTEI